MNAKPDAQLPAVSVIMPVLNEERHLRGAVQAILAQEYAGEMEVVIALGPSTDRTDEIAAELVAEDSRVHTVPNPTGRTPAALNAAIKASRHPIVVRVDGHGMLSPNYIATAVRLLEETGAQNVGGIMHAEGENDWEHAVAAAMTSKIGVGNAAFHTGGEAGAGRDRLPRRLPARGAGATGRLQRGVHPRPGLGAELPHPRGGRPHLVLARAEGLVPPAPSVKALAKQYKDYGRWRHVVARYHAGSINLRYLAPPTAVCAIAAGLVVGAALTPWGFLVPGGYLAAIALGLGARGQGTAAEGPAADPGGPRDHAHVVGLGLPDQPEVAGEEGHRVATAGGTGAARAEAHRPRGREQRCPAGCDPAGAPSRRAHAWGPA